jgi:hypothetical protein
MIQSQLERVDSLPAYPKEEIVELITEAQSEVAKPKPNGTKLRSALTDISTAIQTVGSLNDAYQLLKAALIPFGIYLSVNFRLTTQLLHFCCGESLGVSILREERVSF